MDCAASSRGVGTAHAKFSISTGMGAITFGGIDIPASCSKLPGIRRAHAAHSVQSRLMSNTRLAFVAANGAST